MSLSIVVAVAENGIIGRENGLPWRLPGDLRRFKALTLGKTLIMGRKTFESLPGVLPRRKHIVLTRSPGGFSGDARYQNASVELSSDVQGVLSVYAAAPEEAFVAGGADVYALALPYCQKLYITRVALSPQGDARFPDLPEGAFRLAEKSAPETDPDAEALYWYETYERAIV